MSFKHRKVNKAIQPFEHANMFFIIYPVAVCSHLLCNLYKESALSQNCNRPLAVKFRDCTPVSSLDLSPVPFLR